MLIYVNSELIEEHLMKQLIHFIKTLQMIARTPP
jgi:hypothetical protein